MPKKTETLSLRCYCCGAPIPANSQFALVSTAEKTDRVFVMLPQHTARADGNVLLVMAHPEVR